MIVLDEQYRALRKFYMNSLHFLCVVSNFLEHLLKFDMAVNETNELGFLQAPWIIFRKFASLSSAC